MKASPPVTPADPPQGASSPEVARAWQALRDVDDPEIGVSIVDVGLVYAVEADAERIRVRMTMTSAACPMGEDLVDDARAALERAFPEVPDVEVELVWDPPWTPERMSPEAREFFGWDAE